MRTCSTLSKMPLEKRSSLCPSRSSLKVSRLGRVACPRSSFAADQLLVFTQSVMPVPYSLTRDACYSSITVALNWTAVSGLLPAPRFVYNPPTTPLFPQRRLYYATLKVRPRPSSDNLLRCSAHRSIAQSRHHVWIHRFQQHLQQHRCVYR